MHWLEFHQDLQDWHLQNSVLSAPAIAAIAGAIGSRCQILFNMAMYAMYCHVICHICVILWDKLEPFLVFPGKHDLLPKSFLNLFRLEMSSKSHIMQTMLKYLPTQQFTWSCRCWYSNTRSILVEQHQCYCRQRLPPSRPSRPSLWAVKFKISAIHVGMLRMHSCEAQLADRSSFAQVASGGASASSRQCSASKT